MQQSAQRRAFFVEQQWTVQDVRPEAFYQPRPSERFRPTHSTHLLLGLNYTHGGSQASVSLASTAHAQATVLLHSHTRMQQTRPTHRFLPLPPPDEGGAAVLTGGCDVTASGSSPEPLPLYGASLELSSAAVAAMPTNDCSTSSTVATREEVRRDLEQQLCDARHLTECRGAVESLLGLLPCCILLAINTFTGACRSGALGLGRPVMGFR